MVAAAITIVTVTAYGDLIGVSGTNRRPVTQFSGAITYDATSGNLHVAGVPTTTAFSASPGVPNGVRTHEAVPPSTLGIDLRVLDAKGQTYEGQPPHAFSMTGAVDVNRDGVVTDAESGVMLTGELVEMGFNNAPAGRGDDSLDFRFRVTGGFLAPFYAGQNVGVYARMDSNPWPQPAVREEHFATSFEGVIGNGAVMPLKCGVALGDFVWHDVNANGIQDAGEPGINGVTVRLRNEVGTVVATTVTGVGPMNQQGYYQFAQMVGFCAGTWSVEVDVTTLSPGFAPTATNAPGSTPATDSNPNPSTVTLTTDISKDQTLDFGFRSVCDGRIGNFVWHDVNSDGIQNPGEPGLEGVQVNLLDASNNVIAATVTSAGGAYEFTGLCSGAYQVALEASTLPAGFSPTTPQVGADVEVDSSNAPVAVVLTAAIPSDLSVDFGFVAPCAGSIGDFVFYDVDQDGVQDSTDPGIDGVTVYLLNATTDEVLAITTTGSNGRYEFTGVCGGALKVLVDVSTLPPARTPTLVNVGNVASDSNPNPALVTLPFGGSDATIDFGYVAPCTGQIGNFVWHDENRNGLQDAGEGGFAGVTVNLRRASDNSVLQTDITDADGAYTFDAVCPGDYIIEAVPPTGTQASPVQQGGNPEVDSNPNLWPVSLATDSSVDLSVDFGFYATGEIGDFVWDDLNADGRQDPGEPGIPGVTLTLTASDGHAATRVTDASGYYLFTGLRAGAFSVTVSAPSGFTASPVESGADRAIDSNVNPSAVTLAANDSQDHTVDFGFVKRRGSVGDRVWKDLNQNGLQDSGEPGIGGVTLTLQDAEGHIVTTTTDGDGQYLFSNLLFGTVTVTVTPPTGYLASPVAVGANRAIDSNAAVTTALLTLAAPGDLTLDFGFYQAAPPAPGIKLVKTANKHTVLFGESVTYSYVVTNTGNMTLTNLVVRDDNATPTYSGDDFIVGTLASLGAGASATLTATVVPPAKMCNKDPRGSTRKCGMLITKRHDSGRVKFTYLQAKDHRDDWGYDGWSGGRSYSNKAKFRVSDYYGLVTQDLTAELEAGDDNEYVNAFSAMVDTGLVTKSDGSINPPKLYHKKGWDRDWHSDWDSQRGDYGRYGRWDDDRWSNSHDNDYDYDYDNKPEQCPTVSTNIAKVVAVSAVGPVTATDKETVQIVAPAPAAPYKTFTQGGWGAKPNGNNPGKFLADNFARVYPVGITIGGTKTIKLTSSVAVEKFLPQGSTPARLTQNYLNPTWDITVLAGQVLALRLNVDFSAAGLTRVGVGALTVSSGELDGMTVNQVLALGNSVLGGGSLPYGLTLSELNSVITKINENFNDGSQNNGYLTN